jgi:peptidylprolyl isomerase
MTTIAKIDGEAITSDEFVRLLKFSGKFDALVEDVVKDRLTVQAAKKQGIVVTTEEVQERADELRRAWGLHRARETHEFLETMGVTLDDFESYVTDTVYEEKVIADICTDAAVEEYFKLNSPKFDSIEVSHIVVDSEGTAKELAASLQDDPDSFAELAEEHSVADTGSTGGHIGKVMRGSLQTEVEGKVFNAAAGELLGPFPSGDGSFFEIFKVDAKRSANLDDDTAAAVRKLLYQDWLQARAQEHNIEVL